MAEIDTISFTEAQISELIEGPSFFENLQLPIQSQEATGEALLRLKKKQFRTEMHGHILKEYLRSNIIPQGLQVKIIPCLFLDDKDYKIAFSQVATKCSRDLLVLTITTAQRVSSMILETLSEKEKIFLTNSLITEAKQKLEQIEKSFQEFRTLTIEKKTAKLKKDVSLFKKEQVYPYLVDDFNPQTAWKSNANWNGGGPNVNDNNKKRWVTFSDTSSSNSSNDDFNNQSLGENPFRGRGGRRGRRNAPRGRMNHKMSLQNTPGQGMMHRDFQTRNRAYRW